MSQRNWEAAEEYLDKAIKTGASEGTRLLRVRALLEQGDTGEAENEMNRYVAGRDVRTLPLEARTVYSQLQTYLDLRPYSKVKSITGIGTPTSNCSTWPPRSGGRLPSRLPPRRRILTELACSPAVAGGVGFLQLLTGNC